MSGGLIQSALAEPASEERRFYGVAVGLVTNDVDLTGDARVQVSLPWLPGYEPWARVAVPLAGSDRGTFMIPKSGDEVLVAFAHGDVREPYVIGSLWNGQDGPPVDSPTDATTKLVIRTRAGHEIELDDVAQSISVTTSSGHTMSMEQDKVELATTGGSAKVTLATSGEVTLEGSVSITLKAPRIAIEGTTVDLKADASATVKSSGSATLQASIVKIN